MEKPTRFRSMKRFFKAIFVFVLVFLLIGLGITAYVMLKKTGNRSAFNIIPTDAVFTIETTNLTDAWNTVSASKIWQHLLTNDYFKDVNDGASQIDSIMKDNATLNFLLKDRALLLSAHMISKVDYDFLFSIDLGQYANLSFITNLDMLADFEIRKSSYQGQDIYELFFSDNPSQIFTFSIVENLLIGSFSASIVEKAINQKDNNHWEENIKFQQVVEMIGEKNLIRFYFNFNEINDFANSFLSEKSESVEALQNSISHSAFNFNLEDEHVILDGCMNLITDSVSYLKAFTKVAPDRTRAYEIVSDQMAFYLGLSFKNFDDFYSNLETEFATRKVDDYQGLNDGISKIEKLLDISLRNDFFSWIGNEIALVKLRPDENSREEDMIVCMHTNSISNAKSGMNRITEQIRKRSPVKFEVVNYHDFEINQMVIKGFFKLFLGKMFGKLEKPYFTYIDDFVVFSNSQTQLQEFIDDFINGKTLKNQADFVDFKDLFETKSNVSIYVQVPKIYQNLYYFTRNEKRAQITKNKELILSFSTIGFQLIADNDLLDAKLICKHDEKALTGDEIEKLENEAADELFNEYFENLSFKLSLAEDIKNAPEKNKSSYPDSILTNSGEINQKLLNGLWRGYYESGNLMSAVNYKEGIVEGTAIFYYDKESPLIKAEMTYTADKLEGVYREFYKNGARKAVLNYEEGKPNGDAEFYYNSGVIKIKGLYKKGMKNGKWKYYDKNGNLLSSEKWKRGNKKD